jgi:cell division FtsZ-interacting protein ZapD
LPYYPIRDAIFTLLLILRSNAKTSNVFTEGGVYQRKLDPASKIDLVTITAKKSLRGFPTISSNKYAINIHFNDSKTQIKVEKIINFKISPCILIRI